MRRPFDCGKLSGVVTVTESFFAVGDCCAKELPSPQNAEMTNTNITILHVKILLKSQINLDVIISFLGHI